MSTDAKDVTRRFYEEIINQKNVHAIDRFCTADFVDHNPPPGGKGSLDATKQQFLELVAAFPDLKMMVQDQIAEGDRVVNRVLVRGTHKGEYMGMPGSGKTVEIGGIDILRMVNGKAAERWGYFDDVKLMQQLGAMPGPTKVTPAPLHSFVGQRMQREKMLISRRGNEQRAQRVGHGRLHEGGRASLSSAVLDVFDDPVLDRIGSGQVHHQG